MNKVQYSRMEILIEQALNLPPEDRHAFIKQKCGTDDELLQEITSLLQYSDQAFEFIRDVTEHIVRPSFAELSDHKDPKQIVDTMVKQYHIMEELGHGGMGIVYKAHDTLLDRTVALKFLPNFLTFETGKKKRLIREARAAAALNHPNICTVYSIEECDELQFISMEYIRGETLESKIRTETLNPESVLRYAIQIVEALAEAHDKDVIHGDIKPGNIMVDSNDRIKVMDFGLAKLKNERTITKYSAKLGTVVYMSPEQIEGKEIDQRSDLFSLGILFYEMFTGNRPFEGHKPADLLFAIVNNEPTKLTDGNPEIPQDVSSLVHRLLEKNPTDRYSNANEVLSDLIGCLKHLTDSNQPTDARNLTNYGFTSSSHVIPFFYSKKVLAVLSSTVLILLVTGYILLNLLNSPDVPKNHTLAVLPLTSVSQEPEDILFTEGFHEALIHSLAGIRDFTVIARRSALRYSSGERDLQIIGRELGVTSLVDGTVRRTGDQLRVTIQLIDINSMGTIWSGSFEENMEDIFAIQNRIAQQVAGQLHATLTQQEQYRLEEQPTDNLIAYLLYMRGRQYLSRYGIEENLLAAQQLFSDAVEEDPRFAQAWAMLTHTYCWLYWFYGSNSEHLERMKETAERAHLLNPNLPETQLALGYYYYWSDTNHQTTLSHFKKALQSFPNQPMLHYMTALTYRRLGNWELLIHHLNKTMVLDPLTAGIYTELSWDYWMMRDYQKAGVYLNRMRELKLDTELSYHWFARLRLSKDGTLEGFEKWWNDIEPEDPAIVEPRWWGEYNTKKRNWSEAIRGYRNVDDKLIENSPSQYIFRDYLIGLCLEFQGHKSEAISYYDQIKKQLEDLRDESPDEPRYRAELGRVYARLGDVEKAILEGNKAVELMPVSQNANGGTWFEMALAEIYAWTGHEEQAIDKLEYLLSIPSRVHRNDLKWDPIWDPLRDHPRFQELVAGKDEPYLEGL